MTGLPRILLVDYDPRALKKLEDLFTESGYQVETAKDGVAALTAFRQNKPDLVLLEAMIPKKHGFEVCQEIKKTPEGKAIPVIITTAVYKGRKYRMQAMHVHGCDEYIEKPCPPETILEIVQRLVPPGSTAKAVAVARGGGAPVSAHPGKRGEVIPFPAGRASHPPPDDDEDAEREIMSVLDDILPDTPMFAERGITGTGPSTGVEEPGVLELDGEPDESLPAAPPSPGAASPPAPAKEPGAGRGAKTRRPEAMRADEVEKLTRSRRRPPKKEEPSPRIISPLYVVGIVIALVVVLISWLLGRV